MALDIDQLLQLDNIVPELDDETLYKMGCEILEGYEIDCASRKEWEERNEKWVKLATQVVENKSFPWPNAANVKYPLLTTACLQFSARAYSSIIPNQNIVKGKVMGFDQTGEKLNRAIRIEKHMSYQLLDEMEDWEDDMDKLLMVLPLMGNCFKKTYYDAGLGRNVSELVLPKDLVVNYYAKNIDRASRKTHVLFFYPNEIEERIRRGEWIDWDYGLATPKVFNVQGDQSQGLSMPRQDDDTAHEFLEQHTWWDLDGDGYKEPYIITVHKDSKYVVRIVARFDAEGVWLNEKNEVARIEPVEYFTNYIFVPDPNSGIYGLGFGTLLGPINETVNTLINQLLDSGTLSNLQSGFLARGIRINGGNKPFTPGEWKTVNTTGDDLRKGIVPLPTKEPSNVLYLLMGTMIQSGKELSSTTDMLLGNNPGQNTPATNAMLMVEQGLKVFSSIYKRIYRSMTKELKKIFRLNKLYLNEQAYFNVLDLDNQVAMISRNDYNDADLDVIPAASPDAASEAQKLMRAQALLELLPTGLINPQEAVRRVLEAQNQPAIDVLMQMPPPQPGIDEQKLQLEYQKFEHDKQMDIEDKAIEWAKIQMDNAQNRSNELMNIAKIKQMAVKDQTEMMKSVLEGKRVENEARMASTSVDRNVGKASEGRA